MWQFFHHKIIHRCQLNPRYTTTKNLQFMMPHFSVYGPRTAYPSQEDVCHRGDRLKACHEFEDVNFATNIVTCWIVRVEIKHWWLSMLNVIFCVDVVDANIPTWLIFSRRLIIIIILNTFITKIWLNPFWFLSNMMPGYLYKDNLRSMSLPTSTSS